MKNFPVILAVIVGLLFLFKITSTQTKIIGVSDSEAQLLFYWGEGCSHCETVKKYITQNNMESKVKISYKEVFRDSQNQQQLAETVKLCPEIDTSQGIGVPLAFDKQTQKCLYGDQPIIDWLSQK